MRSIQYIFFIGLILLLAACKYSFRGISIPPNVDTFFVEEFLLEAYNAPAGINVEFSEQLKQKVLSESRLQLTDTDPQIEFQGAITEYSVSAQAPEPGEVTGFNRLVVRIAVDYIDHTDEEKNWSKTYRQERDFGSDENLLNIQDDLVNSIYSDMTEDIFRDAFTDW